MPVEDVTTAALTVPLTSLPAPPAAAAVVFGRALPLAEAYAALLCGAGVERGILGPREPERIWDRHLLNAAILAAEMPADASVSDVGSGGGLPGVVLALARPDLRLTLIDSMERRTRFLSEVVAELGLADRVSVVRGRAEELRRDDEVVVARAVADPVRLAGWSKRLLRPGGRLHVLGGQSLLENVADIRTSLQRSGWDGVSVSEASLPGVTPSLVLRASRR